MNIYVVLHYLCNNVQSPISLSPLKKKKKEKSCHANCFKMENIKVLWCQLLLSKFKVLTFFFWLTLSHWFFKSYKVKSLGQCENSLLGMMTLKWFVTVLQIEQRRLGIISCKDDTDFHLFKNFTRIEAIFILHKPKYLHHIYAGVKILIIFLRTDLGKN